MNFSDAGGLYVGIVFGIACLVLWAGFLDLRFMVSGVETISEWLRKNPPWLVVPVAVNLIFIAVLLLHIFVKRQ